MKLWAICTWYLLLSRILLLLSSTTTTKYLVVRVRNCNFTIICRDEYVTQQNNYNYVNVGSFTRQSLYWENLCTRNHIFCIINFTYRLSNLQRGHRTRKRPVRRALHAPVWLKHSALLSQSPARQSFFRVGNCSTELKFQSNSIGFPHWYLNENVTTLVVK